VASLDKFGGDLWSPAGVSGIRSQTGQVRWGFLESGEKFLESGGFTRQVQ
jgi:hypothetical protein